VFSWLNKAVTESDNKTPCILRILSTVTGILYHAAVFSGLYLGAIHLDMASIGLYLQHMVTLTGTAGGAIGVKSILKGDAPAPLTSKFVSPDEDRQV